MEEHPSLFRPIEKPEIHKIIYFYQLANGDGWIHDFNENIPDARVIKLKVTDIKFISCCVKTGENNI